MQGEDSEIKISWSHWYFLIPFEMPIPEPSYKDIELLGTKLDTKKDIAARKAKVWHPIRKFRHFFKSKRLSTRHKIRIYKTYVETTLLYNSETWTLIQTLEKSLNSFHKRLLRIALNIKYPKIASLMRTDFPC